MIKWIIILIYKVIETYFSDDEIDGNKEKELEKLSLQLDQINDEMDKLEKSIMQKELENNQEYE